MSSSDKWAHQNSRKYTPSSSNWGYKKMGHGSSSSNTNKSKKHW